MIDKQEEEQKALKKIADYLSRRSHSEKELKLKLSKNFSEDSIHLALEKAKEKKWLEDEQELSNQTAKKLHKKNKSWKYIEGYIDRKGLPCPEYDEDLEIKKLRALISKKCDSLNNLSFKDENKLKHSLVASGFTTEIIEQVFRELLRE